MHLLNILYSRSTKIRACPVTVLNSKKKTTQLARGHPVIHWSPDPGATTAPEIFFIGWSDAHGASRLQNVLPLYRAASGRAETALTLADHEPIVNSVTNALETGASITNGQYRSIVSHWLTSPFSCPEMPRSVYSESECSSSGGMKSPSSTYPRHPA